MPRPAARTQGNVVRSLHLGTLSSIACQGTISTATSFLRRNPGMKGGLYLIKNGSPMVLMPFLASTPSISDVLASTSFRDARPLNLNTATNLSRTFSIAIRPSSGSGIVSIVYCEGMTNEKELPPDITGAVMAIFSEDMTGVVIAILRRVLLDPDM